MCNSLMSFCFLLNRYKCEIMNVDKILKKINKTKIECMHSSSLLHCSVSVYRKNVMYLCELITRVEFNIDCFNTT